jgi:hypothetical protein
MPQAHRSGKSEEAIAREIIYHLDGLSIEAATNALRRAIGMLSSSQVVSAKSPLLKNLISKSA